MIKNLGTRLCEKNSYVARVYLHSTCPSKFSDSKTPKAERDQNYLMMAQIMPSSLVMILAASLLVAGPASLALIILELARRGKRDENGIKTAAVYFIKREDNGFPSDPSRILGGVAD